MTTAAPHEAPVEHHLPQESVNHDLIIIARDRVAYHGSYHSAAERLQRTADVLRTVDIFADVNHMEVTAFMSRHLGEDPDAVFNGLSKLCRDANVLLYAATSPKPVKVICAPEPVLYSVLTAKDTILGPETRVEHFTSAADRLAALRARAADLCPNVDFDATVGAMDEGHLALTLSMLMAPAQVDLAESRWSDESRSYH